MSFLQRLIGEEKFNSKSLAKLIDISSFAKNSHYGRDRMFHFSPSFITLLFNLRVKRASVLVNREQILSRLECTRVVYILNIFCQKIIAKMITKSLLRKHSTLLNINHQFINSPAFSFYSDLIHSNPTHLERIINYCKL